MKKLEVSPYNRVSRRGIGKHAFQSLIPQSSHFAISQNGLILVTVHQFVSELEEVGRPIIQNQNDILSSTTVLKFWKYKKTQTSVEQQNNNTMPYRIMAVVTNPHGYGHGITGIALSKNGKRLATMSATENAFRMWEYNSSTTPSSKSHTMEYGEEEEEKRVYQGGWKCVSKVETPTSLTTPSNTISGAMAFNPILSKEKEDDDEEEESVLAIAYGKQIAIWDVSISNDYPILLTHLSHYLQTKSSRLNRYYK